MATRSDARDDDGRTAAAVPSGSRLIAATWAVTALFAAVALAAVLATDTFGPAVVVVSSAAFALGLVAFAVALVTAAARSRREELSVGGLFFLAGSAPAAVRRHLLGALAVQTAVALAAAGTRPFTALAFGILVPTSALGACGLWAARHGTFPARRAAGPATPRPATPEPPHGS